MPNADTQDRKANGQLGYTREDYDPDKHGYSSVSDAARQLGVSRQAVIDQWKRYGITNPHTGRVPGADDT